MLIYIKCKVFIILQSKGNLIMSKRQKEILVKKCNVNKYYGSQEEKLIATAECSLAKWYFNATKASIRESSWNHASHI